MISILGRRFRSVRLLVFTVLFSWVAFISICDSWPSDRIQNDVLEYYSYLPATFICHDIALENPCEGRYWPAIAPNGGRVFKMTMGMSMVYLPFFTVAHFIAPLFNEPQDGYSDPYQKMILLASLFYALLGLIYTFKSLQHFFSEQVSFITTMLIFFSTNLFYYSSIEPGMTHSFLFGLGSVFIYLTIKWNEQVTYRRTLLLGLLFGLMVLIRPTSILFFVFFLLYNVKSINTFNKRALFFLQNYLHILLIVCSAFLVLFPQLMYWKHVTGDWIYYSYGSETFFWTSPHILDGLFSFRKGWFTYTPIMLFAVLGVYYYRKVKSPFLLPLLIFLPLFIYVMLSWWCWWYGGSFGQRAFIDIYCIMAFPLASVVSHFLQKKVAAIVLSICFVLFSVLNIFQSWQYAKGVLHYDSMTKETYVKAFGEVKPSLDYYHALWEPDYNRAVKGKPEVFDKEEIFNTTIALKIWNLKYLSLRSDDILIADTFEKKYFQHFKIIKTGKNKGIIVAANNKYVGVGKHEGGCLTAVFDSIGKLEQFDVLFFENNYISLRSSENKYVRIDYETNLLFADSDSNTADCMLRVVFED